MTFEKFAELSTKYFGGLLKDHGFSMERDRSPLFFRKNDSNIYHFISPRLGSAGRWFDIMVFGHSPLISDDFWEHFPTGMDVPTDNLGYLHPITGVGVDQKQYLCNKEEGFIRNFTREAKPALEQFGLPYLDSIKTLTDLVKIIHPNVRHAYKIPGDMV